MDDFLISPGIPKNIQGMSAAELRALIQTLEQYDKAYNESGIAKWFVPNSPFSIDRCVKHKEFFKAGAIYPERLFMAGNRVGKSVSGSVESSCHATGLYPTWWEGKTFNYPTNGWAVGDTAQTTRDTCQKELLGSPGALGTGTIPRELILEVKPMKGTPNAYEQALIKHVSGGTSTITFKSYAQEVRKFYGTAQDWVWLDEEVPEIIYNECLIRTMTTGGILYVTFTPLHGLTPFIVNFMKNATYLAGAMPIIAGGTTDFEETDFFVTKQKSEILASTKNISGRAVVQAGWSDAPWLGEEVIERMKANTPPHLLDARMKGYPTMGSGNVYPIPLELVQCAPFEIPASWKRMYALDVGWNRTAAVWAAIDPADGTIYLYSEYYVGESRPEMHAAAIRSRGENIRGVIDPASRGRGQKDGEQLLVNYKNLGLRIRPAKNALDAGIYATWSKLSNGRIKVFSTLQNWAKEYLIYRRDINGKIMEGQDDHLMDAMRYVINNLEVASAELNTKQTRRGEPGGRKYDI